MNLLFSMTARKYKLTYVVHIIFLLDSTVLESLPHSQGTNNACWKHRVNSTGARAPFHLCLREPIDPAAHACLSH